MTIVGLVVTLIVIGVLLWGVNSAVPMAPPIKNIINVVVVVATILWLAESFGVFHSGYVYTRPLR